MHAASRLAPDRRYIVRNIEGGALLERFFVCAVLAFLLLRFYLQLTGFPRVGGHGLHVAHMLWGGLLMLSAVVILLAFLGNASRRLAAALGGVGFGIFIDELGKFITSDNNYFYRPTVALIYIIFMALFLVLRKLERGQPHSDSAYLVNAFDAGGDAILHGFDTANKDKALAALDHIPPGNQLADALRAFFEGVATAPDPAPGVLARAELGLAALYRRLVRSPLFDRLVMTGFAAYAVFATAALVAVAMSADASLRRGAFSLRADVLFASLADAMIVMGALSWRRSRLAGLVWFKRAILVTILFAQPFLFYREQLAALAWLVLAILIFETLNYSIDQERLMAATSARSRGQRVHSSASGSVGVLSQGG
jgi:hypothetical protein